MIILNDKMFSLYKGLELSKKKIATNLLHLSNGGFIENNGCYFLKKLYNINRHLKESNFPDKTGFECFVNSIHIDDYTNDDFLAQAIFFLNEIFINWSQDGDKILKGIIGQTEYGANIKFHVVRDGENWIDEKKIDEFKDGLIIQTSTISRTKGNVPIVLVSLQP